MGKKEDIGTRERIIQAARALFVEGGLDGVNMREIAEKAGVNKGLLHYYFKTKDSIFLEVFQQQAGRLYTSVLHIMEEEGPFEQKVEAMVAQYFTLLGQTPSLPAFVVFEVQRDPAIIAKAPFKETMVRIAFLIEPELRKRRLPEARSSGIQFLLDMVSLCAFTFAMLPGISRSLGMNKEQQQAFLQMRQEHIVSVLKNSLKP